VPAIVYCRCKQYNNFVAGDACVGKTALTQVFQSGGSTYPKNYMMVRVSLVYRRSPLTWI
jgi:hypothetical protein